MLYTEQDLETSMEKIETINFHEEKEVNGIKFWWAGLNFNGVDFTVFANGESNIYMMLQLQVTIGQTTYIQK